MNAMVAKMEKRIGLYVAVIPILLIAFVSLSYSRQGKESIYASVPSLVVQLVSYEGDPAKSTDQLCRKPAGTGFFISTTKKPGNLYLVTARHVVSGPDDLYARVPLVSDETGKRRLMGLHLKRSDWMSHPNEGDENILRTDIAMVGVGKLVGLSGAAFLHCEGTCEAGLYNQLAKDPEPPEDITVYGFPGDIGFKLKEPRPLARKGIVALSAEKGEGPYIVFDQDKNKTRYFNSEVFLIDIDAFPGSSGSPILRFPLHSFVPYLGGLIVATDKNHRASIAEPVSHILELLEIASNRPRAERTWFDLGNHPFPDPC